jgi:hypothetical protein
MFEPRLDGSGRKKTEIEDTLKDPSDHEATKRRHNVLMELLEDEGRRQGDERMQMALDADYYDHLQWRPEDAQALMDRGQAPLVFNEARTSIDWISGTEKRMRKDYKVLPREDGDDAMAEVKTKCMKYTDDANLTQWHRSRAFKQAAIGGLSWLEEGINTDPSAELIFADAEDWRNVFRDSRSTKFDLSDARYLFRRKIIDLDYALALLPSAEKHLKAIAGRQGAEETASDIWYLGERLTGAAETEWGTSSAQRFGDRSAYVGSDMNYTDHGRRQSCELLECWYRVPETVKLFGPGPLHGVCCDENNPDHAQAIKQGMPTYSAVKMKMRVMIATKDAPLWDGPSPFKHNRFLLIPIWAYRRGRDGQPYGVMRGMRDIQDDLNKRRSKALFALSSNRAVMDENAVEDVEEARLEIARPDMLLIKKKGTEIRFEKPTADFQGNLELANMDSESLRNVGGVTNENLGRDTNSQSGRAVLAKQDQGSLTSSELFDNLMLAIKLAGQLRLSHIEQFWTAEKVVRITGEGQPIEWIKINEVNQETGEIMNDITATEADFVVDTQDYRSSLAQAALEQMFDLLGKIATFAPQVVLAVLDLMVETADIKNKAEWVARIRKINGQRDPTKPPTPEQVQAEKASEQDQALQKELNDRMMAAKVAEVETKTAKMSTEEVLTRIDSMLQALAAAQIVATVPGVAPVADEIALSAGLQDMHPGDIVAPPIQPAPIQPAAVQPMPGAGMAADEPMV